MTGTVDGAELASLSILQGATPAQLDAIAALMWRREAETGEVLVTEGDPGRTFGLLLSGLVSITRSSSSGTRELARVSPGSILGELAVLRDQPRTANLTALQPSVLAVGEKAALGLLLGVPAIFERVRRLASARLARDLRPVPSFLKDGTQILVRPLLPEDRERFGAEVHRLSLDSRRKRFFSSGEPSEEMIDYLIDIDYVDHFAWVVVDAADPHKGLATARFVRLADPGEAEIAFGTREGYHGRGLATFLLGAVGVAAHEGGLPTLVAHVLDDNAAMRAVFSKVGSATTGFDEPGVLRVTMESSAAAALLDESVRSEIAAAVHDIVTAASLALSDPDPPAAT